MTPSTATRRPIRSRDLSLPAGVLSHLRRALRDALDPLQATHLLHEAGFGAGPALQERFEAELGSDPASLSESVYWERLGRFLAARGWGRIRTERIHPALGMIRALDWAEADVGGSEAQPGCHFSSGLLAYLLGSAADAPIAVLEVRCRSRGDEECGFIYGSEAGIHEAYGLLLDGAPLQEALAQL